MAAPPLADSAAQTEWEARELRQSIIQKLALATMVGAGVTWTTVGAVGRFDRSRFLVFLALSCFGVLIYVLNRYYRRVTRFLLLVGPTIILMMALVTIQHPLVPAFASLIVIANAIASPWLGGASAVLCSLLLWAYAPAETLLGSLALVWASAALQLIITQGLYTTLKWSTMSQERILDLLAETRERRGELRKTLDSLTEATRRLERTRHELAVARQQAEESRHIKAQFAANISHELRTPLNLMIGFSEMMYRTPEVYGNVTWTPALRADIREIYSSARHLMGMVDDILDLARVEVERLPLRLEQTDFRELIGEATETAANLTRQRPIELVVDVPDELPLITVDRARIRQVIINLLNNAIRFTDVGSITVSARREADELLVTVRDTGVGIPQDQLGVIFEEFGQATGPITSGRGGIGLGLAICQQFVRLHGGSIRAESEVGVGSAFIFALPVETTGALPPHLAYYAPEEWSPTIPENPMGKSAIVLLPEQGDASVARQIEGYRALPVSDLAEMGELVKEEHPAGVVLLSDPFVPGTTTPEDVWLAAERRDLPVVSCHVPMDRSARKALGIDTTLRKPVSPRELQTAVSRAAPGATRFLLVDDDAGFCTLLSRMLGSAWPQAEIHRAYTGDEATELLRQTDVEVVFLDLILAEGHGLELLSGWRQQGLLGETSVILTTGATYEEDAARMRPTRIEVTHPAGHGRIGRYIAAILDVSPPNYSQPLVGALMPNATKPEPGEPR